MIAPRCASVCVVALLFSACGPLLAQVAGTPGKSDLIIADGGRTDAVIVVSPAAGEWEKRGAEDLALYIEKMTGAKPRLAATAEEGAAAPAAKSPTLIVGQA